MAKRPTALPWVMIFKPHWPRPCVAVYLEKMRSYRVQTRDGNWMILSDDDVIVDFSKAVPEMAR